MSKNLHIWANHALNMSSENFWVANIRWGIDFLNELEKYWIIFLIPVQVHIRYLRIKFLYQFSGGGWITQTHFGFGDGGKQKFTHKEILLNKCVL